MQKYVNLVDLVKSFPMNIYLRHLASIQERTSPLKFAHLAEKSERKVRYRTFQLRLGQLLQELLLHLVHLDFQRPLLLDRVRPALVNLRPLRLQPGILNCKIMTRGFFSAK